VARSGQPIPPIQGRRSLVMFSPDQTAQHHELGYEQDQGLRVQKSYEEANCLVDILKRSDANVTLVGCQKICPGPVAGIELSGRMEWFSRIETTKRIRGGTC
jgi:hypothetical protein